MGEGIARVGVDGADRRLTRGQMVRVAGVDEVPAPLGRRGEHPFGPDLADDPADVTPQLDGGVEPPVGVAQEPHIGHADLRRRGPLLALAQLGHVRSRHGAIGTAGVAVGDDAVRDSDPGFGKGGHRARRPEIDVVGVGRHDQDATDTVVG